MQTEINLQQPNTLKKYLTHFDKVTSNNGTDWLLALTWVILFEFISSILEYSYLDIAQNYVYHVPEGLYKELGIALLLVLFIWYSVYSIVFMRRKQFFTLALYGSICMYLLITHDVTFNLLVHNLVNPFEFELNGFGFYMIIQLFIKITITYLIFMMLKAIKHSKK